MNMNKIYRLIGFSIIVPISLTFCSTKESSYNDMEIFRCDSGEQVKILYGKNESLLKLVYKGKTNLLTLHMSASGMRYDSNQFIWWIKGDESSLFDKSTDSAIEKNCRTLTIE